MRSEIYPDPGRHLGTQVRARSDTEGPRLVGANTGVVATICSTPDSVRTAIEIRICKKLVSSSSWHVHVTLNRRTKAIQACLHSRWSLAVIHTCCSRCIVVYSISRERKEKLQQLLERHPSITIFHHYWLLLFVRCSVGCTSEPQP